MHHDAAPNHYARGCLLREQGRYELAADEFRAAMTADPADSCAAAMLSLMLNASGKWKEACSAAEEAVRRDPDEPLAFIAVGYALAATGRFEGAVRAGHEVLRLDPDEVDAYVLLAQLYKSRENWTSVLRFSESALAVAPLDRRASVMRAEALIALGRVDEATCGLRLSLRHNPDSSDLHELLGLALLHAGEEPEAFSHLREALRINPHSDRARGYLVEAMKSRSRAYRATLRTALWFRRRKGAYGGLDVGLVGFYICIMMLSLFFWQQAFPWLLAGFGVGFFIFLCRRLSMALFDLVLQFDPLGRHLLDSGQRYGAWTVGGCFVIGAIAFVAALFEPVFLLFAIPTATIAPWVLYSLALSACGPTRRNRIVTFGIPVIIAEAGLLLLAMTVSFRLDEGVRGIATTLLALSLMWLAGAGFLLTVES